MSDDESPTGGHQPNPDNDAADNSIIEKVRSRVTSIIPQSISKWFSPTSSTSMEKDSSSNGNIRRRRNEIVETRQIVDSQVDTGQYTDDSDVDINEQSSRAPPSKRVRLNNAEEHTEHITRTVETKRKFISSTPTTSNRRRYLNLPSNEQRPAPYDFTSTLSSPLFTSTLTGTSGSELRPLQDDDETDEVDVLEVIPQYISNPSTLSRRHLNIPSTSSTRPISSLSRQPISSIRRPNYSQLKRPSISPGRVPINDDDMLEEGNEDNESNNEEQQNISSNNNNRSLKMNLEKSILTNGIRSSSNILATDTASESGDSQCSSLAANKIYEFGSSAKRFRSSVGSGLNFSTHLQGEKSLFSEKNMPNTLNNSTTSLTSLNRRQSFNPSLYGSMSALSDSRLLNTSSPFYKGRTTYGGASAYSKYTPIRRIEPKHTDTSSPALSNAAKRVLHILNSFTSPLEDARKMATSTSKLGQMRRFGDVHDTVSNSGIHLRLPRTPYSRTMPSLSGIPSQYAPPKDELNVPSKLKLLQMKKLQTNTEKVRDIAIAESSEPSRKDEVDVGKYKLPIETSEISGRKPIKQVKKIKNKISSTRSSSKRDDDNETVQPVNLPEISLPAMKSVPKIDLDSSTPKVSATDNTDNSQKSASSSLEENNILEKSKQLPTTDNQNNLSSIKFTSTILPNSGGISKNDQRTMTTLSATSTNMFSHTNTSTVSKNQSKKNSVVDNIEFTFSSPIVINQENIDCIAKASSNTEPIIQFKFSEPVSVNNLSSSSAINFNFDTQGINKTREVSNNLSKIDTPSTIFNNKSAVPQLKTTGSVLDILKKSTTTTIDTTDKNTSITSVSSKGTTELKDADNLKENSKLVIPSITIDFATIVSQQASKWECTACLTRNEVTINKCACCKAAKPSSSNIVVGEKPTTNIGNIDDGFKKIVAQQSSKWECSSCLTRNDDSQKKCACCEAAKPSSLNIEVGTKQALNTSSMDDGFKKIASQQSSKWECSSCLTRNDDSQKKCACCEQVKPGTVVDAGFKSLVKQQSAKWECTACLTRNEPTKSKCACCEQVKPGSVKKNVPQFTFGSQTSKFTFGFGQKSEEDLKSSETKTDTKESKTLASKTESLSSMILQNPQQTVVAASTSTPIPTFTFGIKPIVPNTKDVIDSPVEKESSTNTKGTEENRESTGGFVFGSKPSTATTEGEKKEPAPAIITFGSKPLVTTKENEKAKVELGGFKFVSPAPLTSVKSTETQKDTKNDDQTTDKNTTNVFQRLGGYEQSPDKTAEEKSTKTPFGFAPSTIAKTTGSTTQKSEVSTTSTAPETKKLFAFGAIGTDSIKTDKDKQFAFSFGSPSSTTSTSLASSTFGSSALGNINKLETTSATNIAFTNTTNSTASTSNLFVFGKPSTSTSVTPSFGAISSNAITSTNKPIAPTTTNSFGTLASTVSSTSSTSFGTEKITPVVTNPPTFGTSTTTQQGNFWNSSFSASNSSQQKQQQPEQNKPATNLFTFGAALNKTENSTPTFGSVSSTTNKPFVFGSGSSNTTTTTTTASTPFGGFGAIAPKPATVTSLFGSAASGNATSSLPAFGSLPTAPLNTNTLQQTTTSPFGQPAAVVNPFGSNNNNTPTFGASPAPSNNPVFGSPAPSFGSTPTFGSASNTPTFGSTASVPTFGSSSSTFGGTDDPAAKKPSTGFNFGSVAQNPSAGFSFGGNNNNNNNNNKTGFTFTAGAAPNFNFTGTQETTTNAPFQFNAAATAANPFVPAAGSSSTNQLRRKTRGLPRRTQR